MTTTPLPSAIQEGDTISTMSMLPGDTGTKVDISVASEVFYEGAVRYFMKEQ